MLIKKELIEQDTNHLSHDNDIFEKECFLYDISIGMLNYRQFYKYYNINYFYR